MTQAKLTLEQINALGLTVDVNFHQTATPAFKSRLKALFAQLNHTQPTVAAIKRKYPKFDARKTFHWHTLAMRLVEMLEFLADFSPVAYDYCVELPSVAKRTALDIIDDAIAEASKRAETKLTLGKVDYLAGNTIAQVYEYCTDMRGKTTSIFVANFGFSAINNCWMVSTRTTSQRYATVEQARVRLEKMLEMNW